MAASSSARSMRMGDKHTLRSWVAACCRGRLSACFRSHLIANDSHYRYDGPLVPTTGYRGLHRMRDTVDRQRRAFWLKHLHRWHWISSAASLVVLLLFSVTGFTLNHAGAIEAAPRVVKRAATLPAPLLAQLVDTGNKTSP